MPPVGQPCANTFGTGFTAFIQGAVMVINSQVIPAGFCVADKDQFQRLSPRKMRL